MGIELRDIVNILYGARSLIKLLKMAYNSLVAMNHTRRIGIRSNVRRIR
jgi:hypothetical protein